MKNSGMLYNTVLKQQNVKHVKAILCYRPLGSGLKQAGDASPFAATSQRSFGAYLRTAVVVLTIPDK